MSVRLEIARYRLTKLGGIWLCVLLITLLGTVVVRALRARNEAVAHASNPLGVVASPLAQGPSPVVGRAQNRLSLQPAADKLRRLLGQRFLLAGRENSVLLGTVSQGAERYTVRIVRSQEQDEERLTVLLNGGQSTLTWGSRDGVKNGNTTASSSLRALVERLALDSPDQFIQAQLRGASYFTLAHATRPVEVGGDASYTGPVWDVIRVDEPVASGPNKPLALWRLYYINSKTGLIDKVVSREQGQALLAEVSGWANQGGELSPTRIVWKQNKQPVMELNITSVSYGPK